MSAFFLQWPKNNETLFYQKFHWIFYYLISFQLNYENEINMISVDDLRPVKFSALLSKCWCVVTTFIISSDYQAHFSAVFDWWHPLFHFIIIRDLDLYSRLFPSWLFNLAWTVWISIDHLCTFEIHFHR